MRRVGVPLARIRDTVDLGPAEAAERNRLGRGGLPWLEGIAGAPFTIYHGEVSADSDGPVEWCWPVPDGQAADIADRFPDLTLRTEPAHQEAFVTQGMPGPGSETEAELAIDGLFAWALEHGRQPADGVRVILVPNPLVGRPASAESSRSR